MKKALKIAAIAIVVILIVAQFVRPDRTNPPVDPSQTLYASTAVPADVKTILDRSCNDCHSNETSYPWYSQVTPVNWWLADHIAEGRRELNVSEYGTYQQKKKVRKLDEICQQVQDGEMPLPSYTIIHRDAILSDQDKQTLCTWTEQEKGRLNQ